MNNSKLDRLDPRLTTIVLIVTILEFELFVFTRGVVKIANQDAWLSVILGGLLFLLTSYLLVRLASRFPRENLFQYIQKVWGRPVGFLISISYLVYWVIYATILLQETKMANRLLFLPETPVFIPAILLAIGAAWLAGYGLPTVVRFLQMVFPFVIIPLALLYLLGFRDLRWDNLLPVLNNGVLPVLKGGLYFAGALQGLELLLFLSPFITEVKKTVKPVLIGCCAFILITLVQSLQVIGSQGIENVKASVWPGIDAISLIELPGFPVERFELFLTLPWITGVFTSLCVFTYLISYGIVQVFKIRNKRLVVFILSGSLVLATYFFPNFVWSLKVRMNFNYLTLIFVYVIPVLTLIAAELRGKKDTANE